MEVSQHAVTEEGHSQTRSPKRKRKQPVSTDTPDKRCRVGTDPPVVRRSLRILAKQKLKEDQELQQQQQKERAVNLSGASRSKSADLVALKSGTSTRVECEELADKPAAAEIKELTVPRQRAKSKEAGKPAPKRNQKRKRTPSPTVSPLPNKADKPSANKDHLADSIVSSAVEDQVVPRKKRKRSKEENTKKGGEERATVIVDFPRRSKSKVEEHSDLETELGSLGRPKKRRRRSKGKSKTHCEDSLTAFPKGKVAASSFSLSSLVDFPGLGMASPE